jgi:uncharacterized protein (DUF1697 family)
MRCMGEMIIVGWSAPMVIFFRAVNVGGHQKFQPSSLAGELAQFDIVSIGAAGTFVVRKPVPEAVLRKEILKRLPFQPEVMICPAHQVLALADTFGLRDDAHSVERFITVLRKAPPMAPALPLDQPDSDKWEVRIAAISGRFVLTLRRTGTRLYSNAMVENRLGISGTTRNWNTLTAIWKALAP